MGDKLNLFIILKSEKIRLKMSPKLVSKPKLAYHCHVFSYPSIHLVYARSTERATFRPHFHLTDPFTISQSSYFRHLIMKSILLLSVLLLLQGGHILAAKRFTGNTVVDIPADISDGQRAPSNGFPIEFGDNVRGCKIS